MTPRLEAFVPDGDEAREWAEAELSKQRYADAKPTWFDLVARDVWRWLVDLFTPDGGAGAGPIALIIVCVVVIAALVAAVLFWGRPRSARSIRGTKRDLLGENDDRSASRLRADAERSARSGDWDAATILRFRAIARGLLERDLIDPAPGATAQAIAREAACVFVDEAEALGHGASVFDDVRYLQHRADEARYTAMRELDERLMARRPEPATSPDAVPA